MNPTTNTVLITGGASGIGLALAGQFLQHNNTVIICGRDAEKLAAAKQRLPDVITLKCDITRGRDLAELQAQLSARFPRLNILVNNAGIQIPMDFSRFDVDEALIEQEIQTNLIAHIKLTNRMLPLLAGQKESAVVFISSALARVPKHCAPVYCASKAGIHSFAQSLRYQLSGSSTKVVEVVPDLVATDMTAERQNVHKVTTENVAKNVLLGLNRNDKDILIGRTRLLFSLHRWLPAVAHSIINRQT
jgi:short-subunit dehydrogenase involved in D-alanine esterification of teichoic acids